MSGAAGRRVRAGLPLAGLALLLSASSSDGPTAAPVVAQPPGHRVPAARHVHPAVSSLVALGDSVPAGTACDCSPFVQRVASRLAARQDAPVTSRNLAVPGQTSAGLLAQLGQRATASAVATADATVLTIGANDFDEDIVDAAACASGARPSCYAAALAGMRANVTTALRSIEALHPGPDTVLVVGYWAVFKDGEVGRSRGPAYVRNGDALTRAVNAALRSVAVGAGARYVDLYEPFKGDGSRDDTALLAADGDHPDEAGHELIAAEVARAVPGG